MSQGLNNREIAATLFLSVNKIRSHISNMISSLNGEALSLDGKALASTVQDCYGSGQDFVMVVSACVHSWGGVIGQTSFQNGKTSEIGAAQELLQQLDLKGVWVTLDALHCQKNSKLHCHQ